jgi:hypothetical protein
MAKVKIVVAMVAFAAAMVGCGGPAADPKDSMADQLKGISTAPSSKDGKESSITKVEKDAGEKKESAPEEKTN